MSNKNPKKPQLPWNEKQEITLLNQVILSKAHIANGKWGEVAANCYRSDFFAAYVNDHYVGKTQRFYI